MSQAKTITCIISRANKEEPVSRAQHERGEGRGEVIGAREKDGGLAGATSMRESSG